MENLTRVLLFIALLLPASVCCHSQISTSSFIGKVTNPDSLPVPGAKVIATHVPTGSLFAAITDENGIFRLPDIEIGGPYTVKITFDGFKPFTQREIYLVLGQPFVINVSLKAKDIKLRKTARIKRLATKNVLGVRIEVKSVIFAFAANSSAVFMWP
jgi:hypothetical protein